jgi:hypothetical protein
VKSQQDPRRPTRLGRGRAFAHRMAPGLLGSSRTQSSRRGSAYAVEMDGCVFFWSRSSSMLTIGMGGVESFREGIITIAFSRRRGEEWVMPYCITLRTGTDATVTGWYAGRNCRWSTDRQRQIRFDNPDGASAVCRELRSLCPRNASVINIELAQNQIPFAATRRSGLDASQSAGSSPPSA